ncbi:MAG: Uma2 family endonuclease [Acidobacteria bacterium]|nr:Uma2 family endonuclease [Acidobacteriota bacterium]
MKAAQQRVSYADLERWPEDGRRYELYNGEVFEIPSPLPIHQFVLGRLFLALSVYVQTRGGAVFFAPLDIVLTDYDVVQPDLLLFTPERQHVLDMQKVTRHAPDLAIEILSPGTASNDRGRKLRLLARHQVKEYWLVDPKAGAVEVYRLSGLRFVKAGTARGDEPVASALLPELDLRPNDLLPGSSH